MVVPCRQNALSGLPAISPTRGETASRYRSSSTIDVVIVSLLPPCGGDGGSQRGPLTAKNGPKGKVQ